MQKLNIQCTDAANDSSILNKRLSLCEQIRQIQQKFLSNSWYISIRFTQNTFFIIHIILSNFSQSYYSIVQQTKRQRISFIFISFLSLYYICSTYYILTVHRRTAKTFYRRSAHVRHHLALSAVAYTTHTCNEIKLYIYYLCA